MLSKTTGYAALALGCIENENGGLVASKQIRDCSGIPMAYLRKVLDVLVKSGLVKGKRGARGGFILTRSAARITVMDMVEAVEGKTRISRCIFGLPGCSDAAVCPFFCPFRSLRDRTRAEIEAQLRCITVADIAGLLRAANGSLTCCEPLNGTRTLH